MDDFFKWPRLYTDSDLIAGADIVLTAEQSHYIAHVLRTREGHPVRLFNGRSGEWKATVAHIAKKSTTLHLDAPIKPQPENAPARHLVFAPFKKNRMEWMIEKAVELGASDFHPVLTQNTEIRAMNEDRIREQIIEAAEQSERLDLPRLHPVQKMDSFLSGWPKDIPLFACIERMENPLAPTPSGKAAFIIGPEGGFTAGEKDTLAARATPVSLGNNVLRCETAAIKALILLSGSE
jgi:16S rRNA (uracil1498-N3)-methyltransferase